MERAIRVETASKSRRVIESFIAMTTQTLKSHGEFSRQNDALMMTLIMDNESLQRASV